MPATDPRAIDALLHGRLRHHRLLGTPFTDAAAVVGWFGAMQAQEYPAARWAVALRAEVDDRDVERAFDEGLILRTHVMRPTWHFVSPADIRWLLALTAPRVHAAIAYHARLHEITPRRAARGAGVVERALRRGQHLTRSELALELRAAGLSWQGSALAHLIMHAELEGLICSGPRRGRQFTYALLDERVPPARALSRHEGLVTLTARYFDSHGPATLRDYRWWSGLTMREVRAGVEALGDRLRREVIEGLEYWSARASAPSPRPTERPLVRLLPIYDEYLIAYKDRHYTRDPRRPPPRGVADPFSNYLLVDGRLAGGWKRTVYPDRVVVHVQPFGPLTPAERRALDAQVRRYGQHLDVEAQLQLATGPAARGPRLA